MIHFLPEQTKKQVLKEYLLRVANISLLFVFILGVVSVFFIIPSFTISYYRDRALDNQFNSLQSEIVSVDEELKEVKLINDILKYVTVNYNDIKKVDPMLEVLALKNRSISINKIEVSVLDQNIKITLNGIAESREGLLAFVKELKNNKNFQSVTLPVSDFVKNSDIDFTLSLIRKYAK